MEVNLDTISKYLFSVSNKTRTKTRILGVAPVFVFFLICTKVLKSKVINPVLKSLTLSCH